MPYKYYELRYNYMIIELNRIKCIERWISLQERTIKEFDMRKLHALVSLICVGQGTFCTRWYSCAVHILVWCQGYSHTLDIDLLHQCNSSSSVASLGFLNSWPDISIHLNTVAHSASSLLSCPLTYLRLALVSFLPSSSTQPPLGPASLPRSFSCSPVVSCHEVQGWCKLTTHIIPVKQWQDITLSDNMWVRIPLLLIRNRLDAKMAEQDW